MLDQYRGNLPPAIEPAQLDLPFVLYLIMGVGTSIAARWVPVLERGAFSPIPFFYVMGGSLVFLFLTWHIPSVASAMMVGAVHLSLADVYYPAMLAGGPAPPDS